jgi:FlaA1/EpsC-like NDP-sugar epimerase
VVRVFSRDETKQAELRLALGDRLPIRYLIGDIRDLDRLRCALEGVDIVFHAAALKHVSACEYNPFEAVQTNVVGTQNLIQACRGAEVRRLVAISTDKAVSPNNTMGATKLLAENMVRSAQEWNSKLRMCSVRFGNVLGSRGSLIPILTQQIAQRREVELTSRAMTRFMMTIPDAVDLVLRAAEEATGGELYILKMAALRVSDLVEVVIDQVCRAHDWPPERVRVREIGPRPGEKTHEVLITAEEQRRVADRGRYYVVRPGIATVADPDEAPLRAEFCSQRATPLSKAGIRELLDRSGALGELLRAPELLEAVTV